ncbi:MAG: DNA primase, partial [Deltaproteobacteria bacterium]|nr:DNA primase [Deltaproteobacteria bacterium]
TGRHATHEYEVEGPVAILSTTTAIDIDEELLNRCLVLTVDEGEKQTSAIHALQRARRTRVGREKHQRREKLLNLHQNAQRLLENVEVVNPFAEELTFPSHQTRTRRDHEKYLDVMSTLALLHQFQRGKKTFSVDGEAHEFVEVTLEDIEKANKLAHEVLGRSLDELPPQTRKLLEQIHELVQLRIKEDGLEQEDVLFSRRELRDFTRTADTPLRKHLTRLIELEYVLAHSGRRGQSFSYELLWTGGGGKGEMHLPGLADLKTLKAKYDGNLAPLKDKFAPPSPPFRSPNARGSLPSKKSVAALSNAPLRENDEDNTENARSCSVEKALRRTVVKADEASAKVAC